VANNHLWQPSTPESRHPGANKDLARALLAKGNAAQAIEPALRALQTEESDETWMLFLDALRLSHSLPNLPELPELVMRALTEHRCRPAFLVDVALGLVARNATIHECLVRAARTSLGGGPILGASGLAALAADKLLHCVLQLSQMTSVAMERLLTEARATMLASALNAARDIAADTLAFYAAIAEQCFINNYVFYSPLEELELASQLKSSLAAALALNGSVPPIWIAAVAAYVPLHTVCGAETLLDMTWPNSLASLLQQQVRWPLEERKLAVGIPALTEIDDNVSRAVRAQYEENPYPMWVAASHTMKRSSIDAYLAAQFPLVRVRQRANGGRADVLVAGCGTGQQVVEMATMFDTSSVLAIDLSLASLSYAKRQTTSIGMHNIKYAQADILQLGSLDLRFDVIISTGVLHHMADPGAGLQSLVSVLRPNGLMLLAFYSEIARQKIVSVQRYAASRGYRSTADDIRRFRQEMMNLDDSSPLKGIVYTPDFYSISECRDLLFHVQEHRMTLPKIKRLLSENGLEFIGFLIDPASGQNYVAMFPDDKAMINLDYWHAFETKYPWTFLAMYTFWVQKRAAPPESET
jgi:SAM-dependent methyltransferase